MPIRDPAKLLNCEKVKRRSDDPAMSRVPQLPGCLAKQQEVHIKFPKPHYPNGFLQCRRNIYPPESRYSRWLKEWPRHIWPFTNLFALSKQCGGNFASLTASTYMCYSMAFYILLITTANLVSIDSRL